MFITALHRRPLHKIIRDGLVGWWRFDEGSGSTAYDASGNGNNASGSPNWVSGHIGPYAIDVGSSSQSMSVSDDSALDVTQGITLSLWASFDSLSGYKLFAPQKYVTTGNQRSYRIYVSSNSLIFALSSDGTSGSGFSSISKSSAFASTGTWYHIAAVLNYVDGTNDDMLLYIDGTEVASGTHSNGIHSGSADLYIGSDNGHASYFHDGKIDDVRIYDRGLSVDEITTIVNGDG